MTGEFIITQPEKSRAFTLINVETNPDKKALRRDIVEKINSPQGINIDFHHLQGRDISSILTFHIFGQELTIRDELGEFATIQFRDSTKEKMLDIYFKGYSESQGIYSKKGVMEMAFSLLCEYARQNQYEEIGGAATHNLQYRNINMASVFSRKNAIDLTSGDTYANKTILDDQTGELITYL